MVGQAALETAGRRCLRPGDLLRAGLGRDHCQAFSAAPLEERGPPTVSNELSHRRHHRSGLVAGAVQKSVVRAAVAEMTGGLAPVLPRPSGARSHMPVLPRLSRQAARGPDADLARRFSRPFNVARLMADFPHPWCICGGWAIDLFLGRPTRGHKDVDIAVLRKDQLAIRDYLAARNWTLEKARDRQLHPWAEREFIQWPLHVVWCKNPVFEPDVIEVLFNEASATHFKFRRYPSITHQLDRTILNCGMGLPILAPQIALLYKAADAASERNLTDLYSVLPVLGGSRRRWLRHALSSINPAHSWLQVI